MGRFLLRWVLMAISMVIVSYIAQLLNIGFHATFGSVDAFLKLMIGVAILSLLNATIGNLLKLLTLPLNCLTFGLFSLIINAVMLEAAGSLNIGFSVNSFLAALIASVLISAVSSILGVFVPDKDR